MNMGKKLLITFVRHGETSLNVQRLLQGHTNTPLSNVGIGQAEMLGKSITGKKFHRIYSSDLQRAYHTAQLILQNSGNQDSESEIKQDLRLRERCYGVAEGQPIQQLVEEAKKRNLHLQEYVPEGAENVGEVMKRAESFFEHIQDLVEEDGDDESILIVSHGGWIQYFMKHLHQNPRNKFVLHNFEPTKAICVHRNTAVSRLLVEKEGTRKLKVSFETINDATHLDN